MTRERLDNRRVSESFAFQCGMNYVATISRFHPGRDHPRHALLRDGQGVASSPLGMALDIVVGESGV